MKSVILPHWNYQGGHLMFPFPLLPEETKTAAASARNPAVESRQHISQKSVRVEGTTGAYLPIARD